jgi:hypothetical protein
LAAKLVIVSAMLRAVVVIVLLSCSGSQRAAGPVDPYQAFWNDLRALCGQAFDGTIAVNHGGGDAPDPFTGKVLRMHVRECSDGEIRVPFHVGDDRSRTWVLTRLPTGVRLKHDHRHEDGTSDVLTMYGGDSVDGVSPDGLKFPADPFSRELFVRENRPVSVPNVWVVALIPGERFSYALTRPGRELRVDFDLKKPVPAPPAPWGAR